MIESYYNAGVKLNTVALTSVIIARQVNVDSPVFIRPRECRKLCFYLSILMQMQDQGQGKVTETLTTLSNQMIQKSLPCRRI